MLDGLTLDQMRVFVVVAEAGSFRQAAARLSRVQSAVSHAIANLEAELGLQLFDRTGHKPSLTAEGRALLDDVRAVLLKVRALKARARGMEQGVELSLSVAVDPLVPPHLMAALLSQMHRAFPTVAVRSMPAPLGSAMAAVRDRKCTLALTTGTFRHAQIETEALPFSVDFVAVVSSDNPLARREAPGKGLTAVELADHLQIVVEDPSEVTEGQDFGVLSPSTWRVGDLTTKHATVVAGIGWGRLPLWMVEADLAAGKLVRLASAEFGPRAQSKLPTFLLRRNDGALGPAAGFLRKALLDLPENA